MDTDTHLVVVTESDSVRGREGIGDREVVRVLEGDLLSSVEVSSVVKLKFVRRDDSSGSDTLVSLEKTWQSISGVSRQASRKRERK